MLGFSAGQAHILKCFFLSASFVSSEGRRGHFFHAADVNGESQLLWEGAVTGTSNLSKYLPSLSRRPQAFCSPCAKWLAMTTVQSALLMLLKWDGQEGSTP